MPQVRYRIMRRSFWRRRTAWESCMPLTSGKTILVRHERVACTSGESVLARQHESCMPRTCGESVLALHESCMRVACDVPAGSLYPHSIRELRFRLHRRFRLAYTVFSTQVLDDKDLNRFAYILQRSEDVFCLLHNRTHTTWCRADDYAGGVGEGRPWMIPRWQEVRGTGEGKHALL